MVQMEMSGGMKTTKFRSQDDALYIMFFRAGSVRLVGRVPIASSATDLIVLANSLSNLHGQHEQKVVSIVMGIPKTVVFSWKIPVKDG